VSAASKRPRVLRVDPVSPAAAAIDEAVRVLRDGGLVAFPTETVYGLGARALDAAALAKVFAAKGRPATHPLIAHVLDEAQARTLSSEWNDRASRLARAFWPGPLTLVVPQAPGVPASLTGGGDSIAIRAPAHPVARALLSALGEAIAAPSANRYQSISPTTAEHVVASIGAAVDLVLDGGPCDRGIESTVVDVRGEGARVLRPGPLTLARLRAIEPSTVAATDAVARAESRPSPGMDARHYAPRARLVVSGTWAEAQAVATRLAAGGAKVGLVVRALPEIELAGPLSRGSHVALRTLPADAAGYARGFYAALHELDAEGVDAIVIEEVPNDDAWWAVADRIRRGSTEE
jgi:L-threonylcarbamoyladenylate synthase